MYPTIHRLEESMATEAPRLSGTASRRDFAQHRPHPASNSRIRSEPLKFLLCGDFRLGEVCQPQPGLDPQMDGKLISAPYIAATQVIDLAIFEQVDFVILVGHLFSLTDYGVQEPTFLMRQFARLSELSIPVIWARDRQSLDKALPDWISWPNNVIEIDSSARQDFVFQRADGVSAEIASLPRTHSAPLTDRTLQIGVIPGRADFAHAPHPGLVFDIHVAASGAWTAADRVDHSIPREFSRGIGPQGRSFDEYGPHGCWLVTVESPRQVQVAFVPCDVIRWRREVVEISDDTSWDELLLTCELQSRRTASSGHAATLIKWQLLGHGSLSRELWDASRMETFIHSLRQSLQGESALDGRISIADVELVFDPREEARLRSEKSAWAAWSSAIDELESTPSLHPLEDLDTEHGRDTQTVRESDPAIRVPYFKKLRRTALHKLIRRVGDE